MEKLTVTLLSLGKYHSKYCDRAHILTVGFLLEETKKLSCGAVISTPSIARFKKNTKKIQNPQVTNPIQYFNLMRVSEHILILTYTSHC